MRFVVADFRLECAEDGVRKARGHASLAIFVGGNEQEPCSDLLGPLTSMLARLVPDVDFVKGSLWDGFADGHGGEGYLNLHDGPYDAQDPMAFYAEDFYDYGFNPEVGSFSIPLLSSLRRFLCPESVVPEFVRTAEGLEMELWDQGFDHHKHMSHGSVDKGVANQLACYGVPNTLKDYCIQVNIFAPSCYTCLVCMRMQACPAHTVSITGTAGKLCSVPGPGRGILGKNVAEAHRVHSLEDTEPRSCASRPNIRLLPSADRRAVCPEKGDATKLFLSGSMMACLLSSLSMGWQN